MLDTNVPFELTVDLFSRMIETGIFPQDSRVFLQNGKLYEKMAKSKSHGSVGTFVTKAILLRLPDEWSFWPESTIVLGPKDAPLPDFAVIRSSSEVLKTEPDRYPESRDIGMLIEVAVTSLRDDLSTSLELYARSAIPVYWVVDVKNRRILVHTEPFTQDGQGFYSRVETYCPGQDVPLVLDGQEIDRVPVNQILGTL